MNSASPIARTLTEIRHLQIPRFFAAAIPFVLALTPALALTQTQAAPGLLVSREELMAAATRVESATLGRQIRRRLDTGDFQIGDRVIVSFVSDAVHKDTVLVRSGPSLELPGNIVVPLAGVLRSELLGRVSTELLKFVKARQIEVTPLMRVGIIGAIAHPGYFALPSDFPLTDVIMAAGGPTAGADLARTTIRRGTEELRSADETRKAIASGLTLDQFGLKAGDELVIAERRNLSSSSIMGMAGAAASILAVVLAVGR